MMNTAGSLHPQERGNVLFLILVAVALFAALSYAVTSSTRSGGGSISKDKARAYAASIIQNVTSIRTGAMRIKISNGCTDEMLDFTNTVYKRNSPAFFDGVTNAANSLAPASKVCHVFAPEGGGITPTVPPADALGNNPDAANGGAWQTGHGAIRIGQIKGVGTDGVAASNDAYLVQNYLNQETCMAINDLVGVTNPSGNAPDFVTNTGSFGDGSANSFATATGIIDTSALAGSPIFCYSYGTGSAKVHQLIGVVVER